jgi:hypothetical protein
MAGIWRDGLGECRWECGEATTSSVAGIAYAPIVAGPRSNCGANVATDHDFVI